MTYENNRKYIPEAWIDGSEDEEFVKSFLKSLVDQIQGEGHGFDADTVDGWHKADIVNEIEEATKNLLSEFYIGTTKFEAAKNDYIYHLGFEAILLYNEEDGNYGEETYETGIAYNKLPWLEDPIPSDKVKEFTLLDTFYSFFSYTEGQYQELKDELLEIWESLGAIEEALDGKIKKDPITGKYYLNADSVNGLRFFIYTQAQYDELKRRANLYDKDDEETFQYKNDYLKLHSIHNIFIIKSEQEIIDSGYDDGIYPDNPDTAIINKYYHFRIEENITDFYQGEEYTGKWLQYSHEDSAVWHNLCPAKNFIDYDTVVEFLLEILNTNTNYNLNSNAVKRALGQIEITDSTDLPITNYNKSKYTVGAVYDVKKNSNNSITSKKFIDNVEIDGFKYIDLTAIKNGLDKNLNDYKIELEGNDGNGGRIGEIIGELSTVEGTLNTIKGDSDLTLPSISTQLGDISARLNSISGKLDKLIIKLDDFGKWHKAPDSWGGDGNLIRYNDDIGIAVFSMEFKIYQNSSTFIPIKNIPNIPSCIVPRHTLIFSTSSPDVLVAATNANYHKELNYQARFLYKAVRTDATAQKPLTFTATGIWYFDHLDNATGMNNPACKESPWRRKNEFTTYFLEEGE